MIEIPLKQEVLPSKDSTNSSSSSTSQWLKLKDPRIVRVSRAFGTKDRHSKVYTIKGLRDRRVRLSIQTAIHLYDLQERLGLSQPSKVVDWLLNIAKDEIDELPPLPTPQGNFTLGYPSFVSTISNEYVGQKNTSIWKSNSRQGLGEIVPNKQNWIDRRENEREKKLKTDNYDRIEHILPNNISSDFAYECISNMVTSNGENLLEISQRNNLLQRANQPSFLELLNTMPLGYQLEPSSNHVPHELSNFGFVNQIKDTDGINVIPFLSSSSSSSLLSLSTQQYLPSHVGTMEVMETRQINYNYEQMMNSSFLNATQL